MTESEKEFPDWLVFYKYYHKNEGPDQCENVAHLGIYPDPLSRLADMAEFTGKKDVTLHFFEIHWVS